MNNTDDKNLLLKEVEYKITKTNFGEWRSYLYPSGNVYHEFTSHSKIGSLPLIHYTYGVCPETGRRKVAKGIIAVGGIAMGIIGIGQLSFGIFSFGQLSFGLLFALAQAAFGFVAIGQLAVAALFALGQFAAGYIAIGQFAIGYYVLAQVGYGTHVWSVKIKDIEAIEFFKNFLGI